MFCPYCGAEAEGGKFCAVCGSPLPIMPQSAVKDSVQAANPVPAPAVSEAPEASPVPAPAVAPLPWEAPAEPQAQGYQAPQYTEPQYTEPQYTEPAKTPEGGKKKVKALPFILIGAGVLLLAALGVIGNIPAATGIAGFAVTAVLSLTACIFAFRN